VIWLGYLTTNNQSPYFVAIFGIASAVVTPIGLAAIGYAFKSNDQEVIKHLAKVPEIEKLIAEANSQEEKIKLLEKQKQQLAEIIQFEARRQFLLNRKEINEREAIRLLGELTAIDAELSDLNITVSENKDIAEEISLLYERIVARQRGDIVFKLGSFSFVLETDLIRDLPLGWLVYDYLMIGRKFMDWLNSEIKHLVDKRNQRKNS
jgi:hypothetical protein